MIYLDSCALLKLIREEEHSRALRHHLVSARREPTRNALISSELTRVEVFRALIRDGMSASARAEADRLLRHIAKLPLADVIGLAAELPERHLRSLDALHLATAQQLGAALTQFITYDNRLGKAAEAAGLPLTMPGLA